MSCPDCIKGIVLPGEPAGKMVDGAYFAAASPDGPSKQAVLLLTDVFGLPMVNCKIQADFFAAALQCDVWVPDLFNGKPIVAPHELKIPEKVGDKISILDRLKFMFIIITRIFGFYRIRGSVVDAGLSKFISKLRAEKHYEKLGAVGYCFGGMAAIRLGATDLVDSIVIAHPGTYTLKQTAAIKVPSSWEMAEEDMTVSHKLRLDTEAQFAARKGKDAMQYEFKDYKGCTHGFATRPNLSYPEVKAGFDGSRDQTIAWFKKTLF